MNKFFGAFQFLFSVLVFFSILGAVSFLFFGLKGAMVICGFFFSVFILVLFSLEKIFQFIFKGEDYSLNNIKIRAISWPSDQVYFVKSIFSSGSVFISKGKLSTANDQEVAEMSEKIKAYQTSKVRVLISFMVLLNYLFLLPVSKKNLYSKINISNILYVVIIFPFLKWSVSICKKFLNEQTAMHFVQQVPFEEQVFLTGDLLEVV